MNAFFEFIVMIVIAHSMLGFVLIGISQLTTRIKPLNASTRHSVLLGVLIILSLTVPLYFVIGPQPVSSSPDFPQSSSLVAPFTEFTASAPPIVESLTTANSVKVVHSSQSSVEAEVRSESSASSVVPLANLGLLVFLFLLVGIVLNASSYVAGYFKVRGLVRNSRDVGYQEIPELEQLLGHTGIIGLPRIKQNQSISSPLSGGVFAPWILISSDLLASDRDSTLLEQILLHELGHIQRRDAFVANVLAIVNVLYFWNPAMRYLAKRIREESELACDDYVVEFSKLKGEGQCQYLKSYALELVNFARIKQRIEPYSHALAWVAGKKKLEQRLTSLLDSNSSHAIQPLKLYSAPAIGISALLVFTSMPLLPAVPDLGFDTPAFNNLNKVDRGSEQVAQYESKAAEMFVSDVAEESETEAITESNVFVELQPATEADVRVTTIEDSVVNAIEESFRLNSDLLEAKKSGAEVVTIAAAKQTDTGAGNLSKIVFDNQPEDTSEVAGSSEIAVFTDASDGNSLTVENFFGQLAAQYSRVESFPLAQLPITGKLTLRSALFDLERSKNALFELYNSLNSNDGFDIKCEREQHDSLDIGFLYCNPEFFRKARQQNRLDVERAKSEGESLFDSVIRALSGPKVLSDEELEHRLSDQFAQLRLELLTLARANGELRANLALVHAHELRYEKLLNDSFGNDETPFINPALWHQGGNGKVGRYGAPHPTPSTGRTNNLTRASR